MARRALAAGLAACLLLGGCGFQLADTPGAATQIAQQALHVVGGSPEFRQEFARTLHRIDVAFAPGRAEADLTVHLEGPEEREQVIAVSDAGLDAREYEIGMHLTVRLQAPGSEPAAAITLSRYRHWAFDADDYLAADEERAVLAEELRAELMEALLLLIQAQG